MMRTFFGTAALAAGASAAILPRDQCCFGLTASGGRSGPVGQLGDGQNRIGGGHPAGSYCLSNGAITDSKGRGCILTPPTSQFQCDTGASPTHGFSISSSGQVQYNGSTKFYACPASTTEYNIYTTPVAGQKACVEITLSTGGKCSGSGGASSSASSSASSHTYPAASHSTAKSTVHYTVTKTSSVPAYSTPSQSKPAPSQSPSGSKPASSASGSACQTSLTGAYQTPHLIVPVSSSHPDKAYGTQYNATIKPDESTVFNFDIPQSYAGKKCSIIFLFPKQSQLQTSSFTFSGSGNLVFSELSSAVSQQTTWNTLPSKKSQLGSVAVQPGNSYVIATESCAAGSTESIEVSGTNGLSLEFFEDYNPSPIGVYITSC